MADQITSQLIGKRIKSAREQLGMTQEQLGKKIGYSTMGISYFEKGSRKIKTEDIEKIANALNTSANYLLEPLMGYSTPAESQRDITFRRGQEDISDEEKKAEKTSLKDFDDYIRSIPD